MSRKSKLQGSYYDQGFRFNDQLEAPPGEFFTDDVAGPTEVFGGGELRHWWDGRQVHWKDPGINRWRNYAGDVLWFYNMSDDYLVNCYNVCLDVGRDNKALQIEEFLRRERDKALVQASTGRWMINHSKEGNTMLKTNVELRNSVAMLSKTTTTVVCVYKRDEVKDKDARQYTYKCGRVLAEALSQGDGVVVRNNNGTDQVVYVVHVDDEAVFEDHKNISYCWIYDRVDLTRIDEILEREEKAVLMTGRYQRRVVREEVEKDLGLTAEEAESIGRLVDGDTKVIEGEVVADDSNIVGSD